MTHEEFFKISIGIIVALLVGIGVGTAIYFFGKSKGEEMPLVSVRDEGGFPESSHRELKPYQYPQAPEKSYPQPSTPTLSPSGSTPQIQKPKPASKGLASPQRIVYPKDYEAYSDGGEAGYDPDKDIGKEAE